MRYLVFIFGVVMIASCGMVKDFGPTEATTLLHSGEIEDFNNEETRKIFEVAMQNAEECFQVDVPSPTIEVYEGDFLRCPEVTEGKSHWCVSDTTIQLHDGITLENFMASVIPASAFYMVKAGAMDMDFKQTMQKLSECMNVSE